jgi:hypothetical protein
MAHFSGALDDVFRVGSRAVDDVPTPHLTPRPVRTVEPLPPGGQGATDDLVREGESDTDARGVICFAYENFFDSASGELALPSPEEFANSAVEALAPERAPIGVRLKANALYESLSDPDADLVTVAEELACI